MPMYEIRAIVRPHRLEKLRAALRAVPNFPGITVFKAEGFTAPAAMGKRTVAEELTDFSPKLMVCVLAEESMVAHLRTVIIDSCSTGQIGDGLVWTVPISSVHRIRNGSTLMDDPE